MNLLRLIALATVLSMFVVSALADLIVDKAELISKGELRAAVQAAQHKVSSSSIYRVSVITSTKVMVWYGDSAMTANKCLILKRDKTGWHATGAGGYEVR